MRKWMAAMRKEVLLLIRDRIGLGILFVMPMVLIFVMTLIQDAAFRTLNEEGIPIVFLNEDKDSLGLRIEQGLHSTDMCVLFDQIDGQAVTRKSMEKAVREGEFVLGIIVPAGATKAIEDQVHNIVMESIGNDSDTLLVRPVDIQLIIDPVASKSFVGTMTSQLREFISSVKNRIMFESFNVQIAQLLPEDTGTKKSQYEDRQVIFYQEEYASEVTGGVTPNAVQHNVPAWSIFAMFFIVIPLAGSLMREKEEGSVFRFHTIPTSYFLQIMAKIGVFTVVCLLQFTLMLSIGLFVLPWLGLPVLNLGNSPAAVFLVAGATGLAATGYGVLVGTLAQTQQQGAVLGSLSILVLSALGGIWVPAYIMPEIMRSISEFSPLHWSLDGFYGLFLRGENVWEVLPHILKLLVFFLICIGLTNFVQRIKRTT